MDNEAVREPYATYGYYTEQYKGTRLDGEEFAGAILWASALVDQMTFDRVRNLEEIPDCVKDASCSAAERYVKYWKLSGREIKSENNDGYSVSYADSGTAEQLEADCRNDVRMYLSGTGLLFKGRSRRYDRKPGYNPIQP